MIRRNVLIFHSGGLGDFVLTWPLGLALGRLFPQSRIIYITQASKGELAAQAIRLDWRDAETSWPRLYCDPAGLSEKALATIAGAHSVYTFIASPGDAFCENVAKLAPEAIVVSPRLAPEAGYKKHVSEYLLEQLTAVPAVRTGVEQILTSIGKQGLGGQARSGGPILIHPGSGGRQKCWPVAGFLGVAEKLVKAGRAVKFILGEVELERFAAADIRRLEEAGPVARPATYVELYRELANAGAFIGNDSGPGHLAGMMGVPTLTLFGPSDETVWRPLGPRVRTLQNVNLPVLPVDEGFLRQVCHAVEQLLKASK